MSRGVPAGGTWSNETRAAHRPTDTKPLSLTSSSHRPLSQTDVVRTDRFLRQWCPRSPDLPRYEAVAERHFVNRDEWSDLVGAAAQYRRMSRRGDLDSVRQVEV